MNAAGEAGIIFMTVLATGVFAYLVILFIQDWRAARAVWKSIAQHKSRRR